MPAVQGPPPGTLGPPPGRAPSNTGTLIYGPPPSFYGPPPPPGPGLAPLPPPGTLPHPSLTRTGFPMPPPGAPAQLPPQILVEPPAPGGPPVATKARSNKSVEEITGIAPAPKMGTHVPLAKCRVLYIGSAVPMKTSIGIDAVQQPLRDRYSTNGSGATNVPGIDGWVTIFSSGMLLQYTGDKSMSTWFPIHTLHVSAAVKCVPQISQTTGETACIFSSLDTPVAKNSKHPPIFATIMRRTSGRKVLECHAFICKSEQAALACVQSTTHAYEHKEGWAEEEPPRELYQTLEAQIDPSDPNSEPDLPLFQPSEKEFENKPPIKGHFYNARPDLIQNFNVHHPNEAKSRMLSSVVPAPARGPMPRPLPMVPVNASCQVYSNPYLLPTPAPPHNYFEDWDVFHGQPVMVFPGPYMSDDQYKRTMRDVRTRRRPRSPDRRRAPPPDRTYDRRPVRYDRPPPRDRIYDGPPPRDRTYDRPPPRARIYDPPPPRIYPELPPPPRRPPPELLDQPRRGPPSDYMDDLGNRYYVGQDDDYGYSYRDELPRPIERREFIEPDPDMVLYAPRYMRHIERDYDYGGDRYPRNDRDFMHSMAEERRLVGDGDRPDPYKINDYRGRDHSDMFGDGGYRGLTRDLGYLP